MDFARSWIVSGLNRDAHRSSKLGRRVLQHNEFHVTDCPGTTRTVDLDGAIGSSSATPTNLEFRREFAFHSSGNLGEHDGIVDTVSKDRFQEVIRR